MEQCWVRTLPACSVAKRRIQVSSPLPEEQAGSLRTQGRPPASPRFQKGCRIARTGLEPVLSALRGRRVNQLHQRALTDQRLPHLIPRSLFTRQATFNACGVKPV